jgi:hypothetical protein
MKKSFALAAVLAALSFSALPATFWYSGVLMGTVCRNGAYFTVYPGFAAQPVGSSCPVRDNAGNIMTDSEKLIPKYAAQVLQSKRVTDLTFEELRLVDLLVKHGYLRPATNGFCGSMTSKAMIRDPLHEMVQVADYKGSNVKPSLGTIIEDGVQIPHSKKTRLGRYGAGRFG